MRPRWRGSIRCVWKLDRTLVGRDAEQELVQRFIADEKAGGLVLRGPSGIGKSAILTSVAEARRAEGRETVVVTASHQLSQIPLGLIRDKFADADATPLGLAGGAIEYFSGLNEDALLVIDNAEWLDDLSGVIVAELLDTSSMKLLMAIEGNARSNAAAEHVCGHQRVRSMQVRAVSREGVAEMLRLWLGGAVTEASIETLADASGGNPLILWMLTSHNRDVGVLRERHGLWHLSGTPEIGSDLFDMVEWNLASLSQDQQRALEVVAAVEPVKQSLLDDFSAVLGDLERMGLVDARVSDGEAVLRLAHPMFTRVLTERAEPATVTAHRHTIATRISLADTALPGDARRAAGWLLDSGASPDPALIAAANGETTTGSTSDGLRFAAAAWKIAPSHSNGFALASKLFSIGDHEGTESTLDEIVQYQRTDQDIAADAVLRASCRFWLMGQDRDAIVLLLDALDHVTTVAGRDEIESAIALIDVMAGRVRRGVDRARPLVASGPGFARDRAVLALGYGLPLLGMGDEALSLLEDRAYRVDVIDNHDRFFERAVWESARGTALIFAGHLEVARRINQEGHERSAQAQYGAGLALFAMCRARGASEQGDLVSGAAWYAEAEQLFRIGKTHGLANQAASGLALCLAMCGEAEAARDALLRAARRPHPSDFPQLFHNRATGWVHAVEGEFALAHSRFVANFEAARDDGLVPLAVLALVDLARSGSATVAANLIDSLELTSSSSVMTTHARYIRALCERAAERLDAISEEFGDLGCWALAAECSIQASTIHAKEGHSRAAARSNLNATRWASMCTGIAPSAEIAPRSAPLLKGREEEICQLAASGLTSREVAVRVFLSARTVDNHLQRVYRKLGIAGRSELLEALALIDGLEQSA